MIVRAIVLVAVVGFSAVAAAQAPAKAQPKPKELTTSADRFTFVQKAQVWVPTKVAEMDLRAGPQGPGAFQPNEAVTCNYVETKLSGTTPKFECAIGVDVVKVRYGKDNGEVQGQVLASRLLWALGFGADDVYPVRVTCRGCPSDPWKEHARAAGAQVFDRAAHPGHNAMR